MMTLSNTGWLRHADQRRVERAKSGGVEWSHAGLGAAIGNQFCHGLSCGRCVEDAPDAMPGGDMSALATRHLSNQRKSVLRHGAKAGLAGNYSVGTERR